MSFMYQTKNVRGLDYDGTGLDPSKPGPARPSLVLKITIPENQEKVQRAINSMPAKARKCLLSSTRQVVNIFLISLLILLDLTNKQKSLL